MLTKITKTAEPKCSFHPAKAARWTIPWPADGGPHPHFVAVQRLLGLRCLPVPSARPHRPPHRPAMNMDEQWHDIDRTITRWAVIIIVALLVAVIVAQLGDTFGLWAAS